MRLWKMAVKATVLVVMTSVAFAQDGATFTFSDRQVRIFEGAGGTRAELPTDQPVTVGNFRITKMILPSESNLDYVGLVIPFRALLDEAAVNLDQRWGADLPIAFVCEAIDAEAPIGFRMRAHASRRMLHWPGAWLELQLGRHATDRDAIDATVRNRRQGGDWQHWYVESDLASILRVDDPDTNRFAILMNAGGRGSFWIKSIEIKPWPTAARR